MIAKRHRTNDGTSPSPGSTGRWPAPFGGSPKGAFGRHPPERGVYAAETSTCNHRQRFTEDFRTATPLRTEVRAPEAGLHPNTPLTERFWEALYPDSANQMFMNRAHLKELFGGPPKRTAGPAVLPCNRGFAAPGQLVTIGG